MIVTVFAKAAQQTPKRVIDDCRRRPRAYDEAVNKARREVRIIVDAQKRAGLEAAGWKVGDAADFLRLTEEEQQIIEFRLMVGRGVRRLRESHHLTQQQLAERIGSSQSRVAKIEAASHEVSLDLMLRGFFSAGGRLSDLVLSPRRPSEQKQSRSKRSRAGDRSS